MNERDYLPRTSGAPGQAPAPASPLQARGRVEAAMRDNREAAALSQYVDALRRDPYFALSGPSQLWVADRLARRGHPHLAKDALERLIARHPMESLSANAYLLLGCIQEACYRDFPAAARSYRAALEGRNAGIAAKEDARRRLSALEPLVARTFVESPKPEEECWILQESGEASSLKEPGVLAKGLPPGEAARRADDLERSGVPVVVVPRHAFMELPKALTARSIGVQGGGLAFALESGERVSWRWEEVLLIAGLGLRLDSLVPFIEVVSRPALERQRPRWRWLPAGTDAIALDAYFGALQQVVLAAPHIPINRGADDAFKRELSNAVIFDSMERADAYMSWQTQLAHIRLEGAFRT